MANYKCPHCEALVNLQPSELGATKHCHQCHGPFIVPIPEAAVAPTPPTIQEQPPSVANFTPGPSHRRPTRRASRKTDQQAQVVGYLLVTLLGVVFIAWLLFGESDSGPGSDSPTPTKIEAWGMAQGFVKDQLKSPSTADFGGVLTEYQDPDTIVTDLGRGTFRVRAWVDSQNGFGAMIRNRFTCEVKYQGNDKWMCSELTFD